MSAVVLPFLLIGAILVADWAEGPKTAFVGVLVAVPMLSAVFGRPLTVAAVGAVTVLAAWVYGLQSSDGQVAAQLVRLGVIVALTAVAVLVAAHRVRRERRLATADRIVAAVSAAIIRPMPSRVGRLQVAARYLGADAEADVGGDFYEVVETPFGVRVLVGDVRGKGLSAVRLANYVLGAFRDSARREADLQEVVRSLDGIVAIEGEAEDFVTAVLLEVGDRAAVGVTCGHPQPVHLRADGALEADLPIDLPLGLGAGTTVPGPVGDDVPLLLHSDGLTEARSRDRRFLPLADVLRPLSALPGEVLLDAVVGAVRRHVGGRLRDDVALLWLDPRPDHRPDPRRRAVVAAARRPGSGAPVGSSDDGAYVRA